jgi:hypothetical protein
LDFVFDRAAGAELDHVHAATVDVIHEHEAILDY